MALKYALLSCLNESRATGYELTQLLRERMGNVWNASHQQTYRELAKLRDEKCVTFEEVPQSDKPDRKVYAITERGRGDLAEWVNEPSERPRVRDPLLLKMFAGELWDIANLKAEIEGHRIHWQATLDRYLAIESRYFSDPENLPFHYRLQHLALLRGIDVNRSWLEWSDNALSVIEKEK
ncbi:PadR family transcriptional regulator [Tamilnaduibacter salinus]|uniref:Transcriptional regulator n=1 Tax=Tamilnaduibacter salinus TaxID=1484056 RepID=A0A2A2I5Y0_9GAMM|nr:PadR family transcriptional regulator [Tamilnaduibacter salinus]PAV26545.1 transcriptional regulator [Tamilnaduibacter salinus]PVY75891.1 PadR family transcriptional regulator [Tamilnaduibacter salinus]